MGGLLVFRLGVWCFEVALVLDLVAFCLCILCFRVGLVFDLALWICD